MEKYGEFMPENENKAQKQIQKLIIKAAEYFDEPTQQSKLTIKHRSAVCHGANRSGDAFKKKE